MMGNCCSAWCIFALLPRLICIFTVAIQAAILDYYLIINFGQNWFSWFLADFATLSLFFYTLTITMMHKHGKPTKEITLEQASEVEMPVGCETWAIYACTLIAKIAVLFKTVTNNIQSLPGYPSFSLNTLMLVIGLTAIVYYFYVKTCCLQADPYAENLKLYHCELYLVEMLDALDLVSTIFSTSVRASVATLTGFEDAIIAFTCLSFTLPIWEFVVLSHFSGFDMKGHTANVLRCVYLIFWIMVIQVPYFIIRFFLWNRVPTTLINSAFMVKESVLLYLATVECFSRIYRKPV